MTEIGTSREQCLVDSLRARDESAFAELVDLHTPMMLRVARGYVASAEVAEDVVQETWIAVLQGIDRFEGRSTLRTWLFRILVNIAKKRGVRDRHDVDAALAAYTGSASVDPARFLPASSPEDPHHWATPPTSWPETPKGRSWVRRSSTSPAANSSTYPTASGSWSFCVTSSATTPRKCPRCSRSPRRTSGCCCIGVAHTCARPSRTILEREREIWTARTSSNSSRPTSRMTWIPTPGSDSKPIWANARDAPPISNRSSRRCTPSARSPDELDPALRDRLLAAFREWR